MPTGTQLKNNWSIILKKYIAANKIVFGVVIYFFLSITLYLVSSIDIMIPCLWKTIFGINCPGCGLTRAFIEILTLDIKGAFDSNPLIFIVLPAAIFYIYTDIKKFAKKVIEELDQETD